MTLGAIIITLLLFALWGANNRRKRNNAKRKEQAQEHADELRRQNDVVTYKVELLNPVTTPDIEIADYVNNIYSISTLERYEELAKEMAASQETIDIIRTQIRYLQNSPNA